MLNIIKNYNTSNKTVAILIDYTLKDNLIKNYNNLEEEWDINTKIKFIENILIGLPLNINIFLTDDFIKPHLTYSIISGQQILLTLKEFYFPNKNNKWNGILTNTVIKELEAKTFITIPTNLQKKFLNTEIINYHITLNLENINNIETFKETISKIFNQLNFK